MQSEQLSLDDLEARSENVGGSLSEFLSGLDLRGRTWCVADVDRAGGFSVSPSEALHFYLILRGNFRLQMANGECLTFDEGDIVMIISGEAHALRTGAGNATLPFDFLRSAEQVDRPRRIQIGASDREAAQILCGRLRVLWPADIRRLSLPPVLVQKAKRRGTDAAAAWLRPIGYVFASKGSAALLTKFASFHLIMAIRDEPQFRRLFAVGANANPIQQALQLLTNEFESDWSVPSLAQRVGMSRSSLFSKFKAEVGISPMKFLADRRLQEAQRLLKEGVPAAQVGRRVGYGSEAVFNRQYACVFGSLPTNPTSYGDGPCAKQAKLGRTAISLNDPVRHRPADKTRLEEMFPCARR